MNVASEFGDVVGLPSMIARGHLPGTPRFRVSRISLCNNEILRICRYAHRNDAGELERMCLAVWTEELSLSSSLSLEVT